MTGDRLFQYQGKAEPVLVPQSDTETVTLDKWEPRAFDPPRPPRRNPHGGAFATAEPSITAPLGDLDWLRETSTPTLPARRNLPGAYAAPVEPIAEALDDLDWLTETTRPRNPVAPRQAGLVTPVLEPTLTQSVDFGWYAPASEPQMRQMPRPPGGATPVLEPSLTEAPPQGWALTQDQWAPPRRRLPASVRPGEYVAEPSVPVEPEDSSGVICATLSIALVVSASLSLAHVCSGDLSIEEC
jgi:hypothetical protein